MPEAVRPLASDSEGYLPGGQTQRKIIFFFWTKVTSIWMAKTCVRTLLNFIKNISTVQLLK